MDKLMDCCFDWLLPPIRNGVTKVVSYTVDLLLPPVKKLVTNPVKALMDVPKDVADMKVKLDGIQRVVHEADKMAADEKDNTVRDGIRAKVKQMIETSFRIEDIMDEHTIREQQQHGDDPGCAALPSKTVDFAKANISRLQFSYMNENVKSEFEGVQEGGTQNQSSLEQRPSSSGENQNVTLLYHQRAPFYIKEADVVGFDVPRKELIDWSVDKREELRVKCVVGQGGQGKTTLVKKVFDSKEVLQKFICRIWIKVSQSYKVEALLRDMLQKLHEGTKKSLPQNIDAMDPGSLIDEVREHLRNKRYVVVFDDVWNPQFWDEMEFALIDNDNGSRVFITTRNEDVSKHCNRSISDEHKLQPLPLDMSLALFNKKVFGYDDGCRNNLKGVSIEIVKKCDGLPLAIVAIGGLLSRRDKDPLEWQRFSQNLSSELQKNPELDAVIKILAFSYHYLPYHLKQCFLYFGIFPKSYEVNCVRLIRQWVAERFVRHDERGTSEKVAKEYLTELINRNLVQPSSFTVDGKPKSCRVHDLVRDMILQKSDDLNLCHFVGEHENQSINGMIRHLTIASGPNNLTEVESSNIQSLHVFGDKLSQFSGKWSIPIKYKLLKVKVLDFEDAPRKNCVPENLGDFFLLRYLSFRHSDTKYLPRSIGMLHNLETLDVRDTGVSEIPREINKLKKLRHLLGFLMGSFDHGIKMEDCIGDLTSLETLSEVNIYDHGEEIIKELEGLTHLRVLGLTSVREEYGSALWSSINNMQHLEKLYVASPDEFKVIDVRNHVSTPVLQKLCFRGMLNVFPKWVAELKHLVKLTLIKSRLTQDPLAPLQNLPSLSCLHILWEAYVGDCLYFRAGGFENLKLLVLKHLYNLNSIRIDEKALPHLKKFTLHYIPSLEEVPLGVYNLPMLEVVDIIDMESEFKQSIDHNRGKHQWIIRSF